MQPVTINTRSSFVHRASTAVVDCPNNNGNGNVAFSMGFRSMSFTTAVTGVFIMDASTTTPVALATRPRGGLLVVRPQIYSQESSSARCDRRSHSWLFKCQLLVPHF